MEVVGAEASVATIVQLTEIYLKISRKVLGSSGHSSKDLDRISSIMCSLNGFVTNLQTHHQFHEGDEIRL